MQMVRTFEFCVENKNLKEMEGMQVIRIVLILICALKEGGEKPLSTYSFNKK